MNKKEFIKELSKQLGYSEEKCIRINHIVEDTFLVGKKNKEKMIERFQNEIKLTSDEANRVYNTVMDIIKNSIKDKLKHPFKSKD